MDICLGKYFSGSFDNENCLSFSGNPDKTKLNKSVHLGEFGSLEECRSAATSYLESRDLSSGGDYECGVDCKELNGSG